MMKRTLGICACVVALGAASAGAGESEMVRKLDEALKAVGSYKYGGDAGRVREVEDIVMRASADPKERGAVEERIARALGSASTADAKAFLCRQLRTIGTSSSVPEIEKLLTDRELSHMARYALASIDDPEAVAALRRALDRTSGKLQAGIVNTLADRGCREAGRDFARLLRSRNEAVSAAAARALGKVGGSESVRTLTAARRGASKALGGRIDGALLVAAEGLLADGRGREAARIYEEFYSPDQPQYLRLAGLKGLAAARGERALPLLVEAVKSDDPLLSRSAIAFLATVEGPEATDALSDLLPALPPDGQELVLGALGRRGDPAAVPAISDALKSANERVRTAALEAMGKAGDASAVPVLAKAAASRGGREQAAARASLVTLRGDGVDDALMYSAGGGEVDVRTEAIRALAGRKVESAARALLVAAVDGDAAVRLEAIRALGAVARETDLVDLVELAVNPKDAKDRSAVERAIATLFRRIEDEEKQAAPVLDALRFAPGEAKPTLLKLLSRPATAKALVAVRAALEDTDRDVRDAAVRALADWPDPAPADDLLTIARTSDSRVHKVLALRGYVRLAAMTEDPTAMYVRAMDLAERAEDRKLVLGGLGTADSAQALDLVEKYLSDDALRNEAGQAAVQIAKRLKDRDAARAKAALAKVLDAVRDERVRKEARDVVNEMEQFEGYILTWMVSGPYFGKVKEGGAIYKEIYPPEDPDAEDVKWAPLKRGVGAWDVNLDNTFGGKDHVCAYVRTRVFSPEAQDAQLELGSDDALKVWLGGRLVHDKYQTRGLSPRQDIVKVRLERGWNELMLKVVDHTGGWAFCCRVRDREGSAVEGLKFEAK